MADSLRNALTAARPHLSVDPSSLLSSGSTLFNLACSGSAWGAFPKGTYSHFVGDTQSGKTLLCYNTLAEASINLNFADYRLIYDNPERRDFWDVAGLWGPALEARIEPPSGTRSAPVYSRTVQDFYNFLYDAFEWGKDGRAVRNSKTHRPFVWIADSMASLDEVSKWEKFEENREIAEKNEDLVAAGKAPKDLKGSYGMAKAKLNSDNILWVVNALADTGSILIIINQTRDRLPKNQWDYGPKQTVAGGHGLRFYATYEIWSATAGDLTRTVNDKKRVIGNMCEVFVKKNSVNGRKRVVEIPLFHSYGVDDVGSCIDFLVEEKYWAGGSGSVVAPEFDHDGKREKLIDVVEEQELESELRKIVQKHWDAIEDKLKLDRKPRYS